MSPKHFESICDEEYQSASFIISFPNLSLLSHSIRPIFSIFFHLTFPLSPASLPNPIPVQSHFSLRFGVIS
jgi:hypothetical protein